MAAACSKDYLTELVAFAAVASLQHYSVDRLIDFVANFAAGSLTVAAAVVKEHLAVEFESVAEKAVDAWVVDVAVASQQTVSVSVVVIAQIVELNSVDSVEYHSEQLTALPSVVSVECLIARAEGQMIFATRVAAKTASVLAATKIAAAACVVAQVNSAAVSGSSTFSAADTAFDSVTVVVVFLPFAFVQHIYLVEHFVPSHCS